MCPLFVQQDSEKMVLIYIERISNQGKDFIHKKSRQIATVNDAMFVESIAM
jgi:hypothetical protein